MRGCERVKILLVDDRAENLLVLENILDGLGQTLVKSNSGEEALRSLLKEDFAVILLDVQMPGIDGFETGKLIRARERSRNTPIVFITATGNRQESLLQGYSLGAVDYLFKPIVPEILKTKVAVFIELFKKSETLKRQAAELAAANRGLEAEILERKRAEEEIKKLSAELEHRVIDRTAQLEVANQELQNEIAERKKLQEQFLQAQKMEAVGQLAAGVAHDFNNLLTIISGYSQLLLEKLTNDDPQRGPIDEIKNAADRAAALTRQLLAFGRRQVLEPQVLDLGAVVANMEKMLRRLIGEDVDLVTIRKKDLGRAKADPGQIEQIVMNLAVNARDAMPRGGKLTIETADVELDEAYARNHVSVAAGPYVMLAVSDTGHGMDAKTQSRIFEPFFTTKEQGKGTGLGLSTVYGIVKQSGGHIWVYSELGRGTTLKIYLPRVEEVAEAVKPAKASIQIPRGGETVLLVEDEAAVRSLVQNVLESKGYKVLVANGAKDALRICERHTERIHLLMTDVVMPEMGGSELADRLVHPRPETKVLYMSGYTDNAIVHHGILGSGLAFLQKPFTPAALALKVREILDR